MVTYRYARRVATRALNTGLGYLDSYYRYMAGSENLKWQTAYMKDINRFYADYYKNTGKRPRYPYKQGAVYNLANLYNAKSQMVNSFKR